MLHIILPGKLCSLLLVVHTLMWLEQVMCSMKILVVTDAACHFAMIQFYYKLKLMFKQHHFVSFARCFLTVFMFIFMHNDAFFECCVCIGAMCHYEPKHLVTMLTVLVSYHSIH